MKNFENIEWNFKDSNIKEYTHCFHNYPAIMIPQIARKLINDYGQKSKLLFDPYCGTGTSLVEANLKNINAIGTDLNPMARLISLAKTTIIDLKLLNQYFNDFNIFLLKNIDIYTIPTFKNIDFWFNNNVKQELSKIKYFINNIHNDSIRIFFQVAFSETIRECSLTRNGEFKLYRMSEEKRKNFNPNTFKIINAKLLRNYYGLKKYIENKNNNSKSDIYDFNTSEKILNIEDNSIDLIITSPPYGDSKTTVAYGQYSRLSNQWLDIIDANQIDNQLMGGRKKKIQKTNIDLIDNNIQNIFLQDEKRAQDVYSFYYDYIQSIKNISKKVKKNGYVCYVVGNRRVKNIILPTDEITKIIFQEYGLTYKNTFKRKIINKRMPSVNSPTNIKGKKVSTMGNEYIVILKK